MPAKIKLQLFPIDEGTRVGLEKVKNINRRDVANMF
jgi:hypothetical protein